VTVAVMIGVTLPNVVEEKFIATEPPALD